MTKKILYVYKWATMGGVERVILNRALAFKEANYSIKQDLYFFHDSGGKASIQEYIESHGLEKHLRVVDTCLPNEYDYIFSIDTPEIFGLTKEYSKIFMECHTAYKDNRSYFKKLPERLAGVIAPSEHFADEIREELSEELQKKLYVLQNCVPDLQDESVQFEHLLNKIPLAYIGRIDKFKNTEEVVDIFEAAQKRLGDRFVLYIAGNIVGDYELIKDMEKRKLGNRFVYLPPVPFSRANSFLSFIASNKGVFISSSKGESFGLSVVEAVMKDIPVLLSEAHKELIKSDEWLYPLGDIDEAVSKLETILSDYENKVRSLDIVKSMYSSTAFVESWKNLMEHTKK